MHKEQRLAYNAEYYKTHQAQYATWREENKVKVKAKQAEYYKANKPSIRRYFMGWYAEHAEYQKEYCKKYRRDHPEDDLAHCQKRRAQKANVETPLTLKEWKEIKTSYNNRCVYCGSSAISQDHIIPLSRGGKHSADNVVPACQFCNTSKGAKSLLVWMYDRLLL
jgi:5-methylcytosine-specific restriction endonuclease McrA